ncbi:MAG TPA: aldo/keto reductase [Candidatus Methylacidiphilales bacterium]
MNYVRLGSSGLKVSRLGLGCMSYGDPARGNHAWTLPEEASRASIKAALDAGINFLDTANAYSDGTSEEIVGRALRDFAKRDEIVLATKCFHSWRDRPNTGGLSRKAIFAAAEDSLRRLGTDYIDLYQTHRWDPETPIEETLEALNDLVKAGKVRYVGVSSMRAWQFAKAVYLARAKGWAPIVSSQPQYSLLYREEERETLRLCAAEGIGVLPWSPLARGRLARPWGEAGTGRSAPGADVYGAKLFAKTEEADKAVVDQVEAIAKRRGVPMSQVALAWTLHNPVVTAPLIGVTKPGHLEDALAALELKLTPEETAALEAPYTPREVTLFD